ncbi:hypothetical protein COOONC_01203, partial [Cooperia oncophora]
QCVNSFNTFTQSVLLFFPLGAAVTACGVKFLQSLKKTCAQETEKLANCIDQSSAKLYISKVCGTGKRDESPSLAGHMKEQHLPQKLDVLSFESSHNKKSNCGQIRCHDEQKVLDACIEEKLNVTRPKMGYFSKLHVHDSEHPAPGLFPSNIMRLAVFLIEALCYNLHGIFYIDA